MGRDWTKEHICRTGGYPCDACTTERDAKNRAAVRVVDVTQFSLRWDEHRFMRFTDHGSFILEEDVDTSKGPYPGAVQPWGVEAFNEFWAGAVARGWKVVPCYRYPNEREGQAQ